MPTQIELEQLADQLDGVMADVADHDAEYIVVSGGRPEAVVIPYSAFLRYLRASISEQDVVDRFDRRLDRLAARNATYSEDEVVADAVEAIAEARRERGRR